MFAEHIEDNELYLEYHRSRARVFLRWAWIFAFLIFCSVFLFAGYMQTVLDNVAIETIKIHQNISASPVKDIEYPDFVSLINENYFGYWAVSGFVLVLFASLGLVKHHTSRSIFYEEEIFKLHILEAVSSFDEIRNDLVNAVLEKYLASGNSEVNNLSLNPLLESVNENTKKIIEKITEKRL